MKIYVVGDFGLDNYHIGKVRGISAEVPIPILDITSRATLPAMAGNVVQNLHALGIDVTPFQPKAMTQDTGCPVKNRLVTDAGVQLARWDDSDTCPAYTRGELAGLRNADVVIVADYGKGAITPEVVEVLSGLTIPVFVDTKQNPAPWIGCKEAILFPNLAEYKAHSEQYGWLEKVVLKLGSQGVAYLEYGKTILTRPSYAMYVNCVNGAGDTVLAAFVSAALTGLPLPQCLEFASSAAANVVEQDFLDRTTDVDGTIDRLIMIEQGEENEGSHTPPKPGQFAGWAATYESDGDERMELDALECPGASGTADNQVPLPTESRKRLGPGMPSEVSEPSSTPEPDYFKYFRQIGDDTRPN